MKKKLFSIFGLMFSIILFCGCEISNGELANSLENNVTKLIYSISYLDSIPEADYNNLISSSSYFNNNTATANTNITNQTNNTSSGDATTSALGGLSIEENNLTLSNSNFSANTSNVSNNNLSLANVSLLEVSETTLSNYLVEISRLRGILILYCTDLRAGTINLSVEQKEAVNEYITIIKETTNYFNNNGGQISSHFNNMVELSNAENSQELINAKILRVNEVLKTRYTKLDTVIEGLNSVIAIFKINLGVDYEETYYKNSNYTNDLLVENNSFTTNTITEEYNPQPEIENNTPVMNENANNNSYLDGNLLNGNNNSLNNNCYGNQPLSYYPYMPCYPVCPRCYTQYNSCTENCLNPENNQANNFDGEKITNNMQSNYINKQNDKYLENADANNNISNNNITGFLEDSNSTNTLIPSTLIASKEINKNLNTEKETQLSPISSYNNLNNIDSAKSLTNYNSAIIENKENIINGNQKNVQENNTISINKSNKNNFNQIENNKAIKELGGIKLVPQNIKQTKIKYLPLKNDTL